MCCDRPRRSRSGGAAFTIGSPCRSRTPSVVPGECRRSVRLPTSLSASTWVHGPYRRHSSNAPVVIPLPRAGFRRAFIGVLTGSTTLGAFPAWLSPVQVRLIPVLEAFDDYVKDVPPSCASVAYTETDLSDDRFGKKIRNASRTRSRSSPAGGTSGRGRRFRRDGSQQRRRRWCAVELIVAHRAAQRRPDRPRRGVSTMTGRARTPNRAAHRGRPRTRGRPGRLRWTPYRMAYSRRRQTSHASDRGLAASAVRSRLTTRTHRFRGNTCFII